MPRTRSFVALIAAATLALTGCGGDGRVGGELTYEDSPLSKYLTSIFSGGLSPDATQQEQQEYYNEQNRKTEELIAQCMTTEGFEYVPNTNNGAVVISTDGDGENLWRPDDRDWVEKYGYGAVNNPWQEGGNAPEPMPMPTAPADPNQEYVESLTEAEQQAYYEALYGKPIEPQPGEDDVAYDWRNQGCYGFAQHEVNGDNPWEQQENKAILDAIQKFYETVQNNPEFAKLDADWSACMTEAGFGGFAKQMDAQDSIYQLINKYWENVPQTDGEMDPTLGTVKDPEYAKIADQEIPLALADLTCREKTDYRQQQLRIQFAAEEQFIADHKEELDAMKARAEQGRK
ncbi:MAG: hypothetical protein KIT69_10245 [Propionibacteriaceae bacterium]|nr:hypothetical protein [Propionibacteriaceae bacterium]